MSLQKRKDKADIISKRGDLIYKELLILIAIAGGSWIYGIDKANIASYFVLLVAKPYKTWADNHRDKRN